MKKRYTSFFMGDQVRPEFRRLIKRFPTYKELAEFLGTTPNNAAKMKERGYLSKHFALKAEEISEGKYKAVKLMNR